MTAYVVSLGAGALAGVLYGLLGVRSPAPPAIALVGLLGLLLGEQIVPVARRVIGGRPLTMEWVKRECVPIITGTPPAAPEGRADAPAGDDETPTQQGRETP